MARPFVEMPWSRTPKASDVPSAPTAPPAFSGSHIAREERKAVRQIVDSLAGFAPGVLSMARSQWSLRASKSDRLLVLEGEALNLRCSS